MPGLRGRPGLRGTQVIGTGWEGHHYQVADGQMVSECTISRAASGPTPPVFDEVAGRTVLPEPTTVYEGQCRVSRSGAPPMQRPVVGDRDVPVREFIVTIPVGTDLVQVNDIVTVTACAGDPDLVGMKLAVTDVRRGSLSWQRDLVCALHPPTTR